MTLDQLRYFQAVCKYGSVSLASEHLQISQPSVSSAIKNLETEFETLLFIRGNKKMSLTKEGNVLLEYATNLLKNADNTVKTMKSLSNTKELNLGVPPMLSSLILPIIYREFLSKHPNFKINIIESDRSGLLSMLNENKINMAFLPHELPIDDKYKSTLLTELENVCCVSKNHPLADRPSINIDDIAKEPLILFKNSFFQTERLIERFNHLGYTPNILLDTAQVSTILNIASSGLAIGFVFKFLLDKTPDLVGVPLYPPMLTKVSLVWKHGEYLTNNMQHLIEFVKKNSFCV